MHEAIIVATMQIRHILIDWIRCLDLIERFERVVFAMCIEQHTVYIISVDWINLISIP